MTNTAFVFARWPATAIIFMAVLALASSARAQSSTDHDWQHGTTLTGFVGAQSAPSSDVKAAGGAGFGWEVTPRLSLEGRATWFPSGDEQSDFAATFAAHFPLVTRRRVVPFVTGGLGLYRATINPLSSDVPAFYRNRLSSATLLQTFQDFALTAGAGASFYMSDHFALRPEFTLMLLTTSSDVRPVGVYGVQFVFHFDAHPIE